MTIPAYKPKKDDILKGVARFTDLKGVDDSLPDSHLPGSTRTLYNVMGFEPPESGISPLGESAIPAIKHMKAGYGIGLVTAKPGNGAPMHVHDTNETFMALEGRWKCAWQGEDGTEEVVLEPYDTISFPPNIYRSFECVAAPEGKEVGLLMGSTGGDNPSFEYAPEVVERIENSKKP